jgi:hypothetical protein
LGTSKNSHVIVKRGPCRAYKSQPGRQEWITAVECICGDGSTIPPLVILTGKNLSRQWVPKDMEEHFYLTTSEKGWTSMRIGEE